MARWGSKNSRTRDQGREVMVVAMDAEQQNGVKSKTREIVDDICTMGRKSGRGEFHGNRSSSMHQTTFLSPDPLSPPHEMKSYVVHVRKTKMKSTCGFRLDLNPLKVAWRELFDRLLYELGRVAPLLHPLKWKEKRFWDGN